MRLQDREPQRLAGELIEQVADRVEVAERLRHLLSLAHQVAVVHPVACEAVVGMGAAGLGDLVLMVREHQVHAAAVDVEGAPEMFLAHGRTLEMPARPATAPGAFPARLGVRRGLPEHEIRRIALVGRDLDPCAGDHLVAVATRELAVVVHGGDMEQDMTFGGVGVLARDQRLHERDHLGDVVGRAGLHVRRRAAHGGGCRVELLGRPRRQRIDGLAVLRCPVDDLVVHVGDVADVGDVVRAICVAQQAREHVEHDQRAGIADMDVVIDRRPAHIHAHIGRIDRLERLFPARV